MTSIAAGGKAIHGAPLGILVPEARFSGIPGDMGLPRRGRFGCSTGS